MKFVNDSCIRILEILVSSSYALALGITEHENNFIYRALLCVGFIAHIAHYTDRNCTPFHSYTSLLYLVAFLPEY